MEPKMRSKGEIMMLRRQQAEERRMVYEKVKAEDRKAFANATWQEKTVRERQHGTKQTSTNQHSTAQMRLLDV